MPSKFIFLVNPISGTGSKQSLPDRIRSAAGRHGKTFEILPTVASGDYGFVRQKIREEGFTDIIICGGDGTVNMVIQHLRDCPVNFGIIPLGSGNGLARTARIPRDPDRALDLAFTGRPAATDAFLINDAFACMLCGIGFDAQVAHDFAKQGRRGLMTYAQESIRHFFRAKPHAFVISLRDLEFSAEAWFISIANSNQFGNNFTIAPRASLSDGLLDVVLVRKMNKARLPFSVLRQLSGGNPLSLPGSFPESGILYFQTDSLILENPGLAPLHVDGEPRETSRKFSIRVLPACFSLIRPS
jgi:diacylglycerol kinase (ATP)